jgi:hypothetical protein
MSGNEGVGERDSDLEEARQRESTRSDERGEGLSFDQLHGQEAHAVLFFGGEECDDVGVIESGDGERFTLESSDALG